MKNLIKLFANNIDKPRDLRIENSADNEVTIYIYDVIDGYFGGVDAEEFVKQIDALEADTIHVRINSPGGDVFGARAIASALERSKAKVIAHIDGIAASAASWIALAADEVEIADGAFFMIHNAWTLAMGDKHSMKETAKLLDQLDKTFVSDYANKTGKSEAEIVAWMDAETWFEAQDAIDNGFADRMAPKKDKKSNQWNLSAYKNAPVIEETPAQEEQPKFDRAALERRLSLLERIAA